MQMIQYGESPNPAKRSEQPVLSLGAVEPLSGESFFDDAELRYRMYQYIS